MKLMFQLLWHVLVAGAAFWLVAGSPEQAPVSDAKSSKAATKGQAASPLAFTAAHASSNSLEQRLAALTPDKWANELGAMESLPLAELPAALRGLLRCPFPEVRQRLVSQMFKRWCALDRTSALEALVRLPSPQLKESALRPVLSDWIKTDDKAAWEWVTTMKGDAVLQEAGLVTLSAYGSEKNPRDVAAWTSQIEEPFLRMKMQAQIAQTWAREAPKDAFEAAFTLEDGLLRRELLEKATYNNNLGFSRAAALDALLDSPIKRERIESTAQWMNSFAREKPDEALAWLVTHSDRPELQKASSSLGAQFAGPMTPLDDVRAAALQLPAGPLRDAFVASAAGQWINYGRPHDEARALLSLCGPSYERENVERDLN